MEDIAGWIAPIATMIAAMMTAANLGARITGWGFVVFSIGSICWIIVAVTSDQQNLLWSNAFLSIVNIVGIWRWLGRRARYDDGGKAAAEGSAQAPIPSLFPLSSLEGRTIEGRDGASIGSIVDAMAQCGDGRIAYLVIREGGVAGLGERLHAIGWDEIDWGKDCIRTQVNGNALRRRRELDPQHWPASAQEADVPR